MCYSNRLYDPPPLRGIPVRGLLHLAILSIIKQKPTYGSEIYQKIRDEYKLEVPRSLIYILLRRMEKNGLISSTWSTPERGPAKRIYRITDLGLDYLSDSVGRLKKVISIISAIIEACEK
ncbi:MAG: hypothetical protein B6U94_06735 [Thermofilum sp. ex4484_79]|nr:MAG: hypothetical protein B6U94_06735 [Thermofilum sp. ex4484_79]